MGIRETILILACASIALAQEMTGRAEALMKAYVEQHKFSGAVLVARGGKVEFQQAYGLANRDWNVPNTLTTKFRIGSVTKPMTAVAILQLEEQGKLKTSDAACQYLPACPEAWRPVTIQQLLNHTSGIPGFTERAEYGRLKHLPSRYEEQTKAVWDLPLKFQPGEKFDYSNTGYVMLGQVIEKVAGKPFEVYLREAIFAPAGMNQTLVDRNEAVVAQRARGYRTNGGMVQVAEHIDMRIPGAAGAVISTVEDLYRFHQALNGDKLLTAASKEKLFTVAHNEYASGWIVQKRNGKTIQGHSGGIDGFAAQLLRIPEDDVFVAVLSNYEDAQTGPVRDGLLAILAGRNPELPQLRTEVELDEATLDEYVGNYEFSATFAVKISRAGKQLITQATNQPPVAVFAEKKDVLYPKVIPATLEMVRTEGKVSGLVLKQGGREMKAVKTQ